MRRALTLILSVSAGALAFGQGAGRDTPASTAAVGTARVTGRVIGTDEQHKPIARVIVTLTGGEIPGGRAAITDDEGRFAFERLPAGRFTLSGTKAAYLATSYGASKAGRPGVPVQLAAGQVVTNLTLMMAHGAAVTGTLRDPNGDPVSNMQVSAFRLPLPGSPAILTVADSALTDDRGVYRIFGLMPGDYFVASTLRGGAIGADIAVLSSAQVDEALQALQARTGQIAVPSAPVPAPARTPSGSYAYAPVFYPGSASTARATKVSVGAGDERADIDFVVQLTRMATIEGTLTGADGAVPTGIAFIINPDGLQLPAFIGATPSFSSEAGPTSRKFKYTSVAPGRYTITARTAATPISWARVDVDVSGEDVVGLAMTLRSSLTLSGRVVFEGTTLATPADLSAVRVSILQTNGLGSSSSGTTNMGNVYIPPAVIDGDGRFEMTSVLPDTYRIQGTVPGAAGWWLRSAAVSGTDMLDVPFVIGTSDVKDVVLTFSDRHTALSGLLQTAAGQPASAYSIVVFPADRAMWRPLARRIQSARTGTDGRWIVKDLPPGRYLVAALEELDPDDLLDATFFEKLLAAAAPLTLGDGEQKAFDLRIGG